MSLINESEESALDFENNTEYEESEGGQLYCVCKTEFDFDKPM